MQLTEHFTLDEMIASQEASRRGINNALPKHLLDNLILTAKGLEKCRTWTQKPIQVLSGYRCLELNEAIGSKKNSQHVTAQACDIISPSFGTAYALACLLRDHVEHVQFDQLIYEFRSWVHISFVEKDPRKEVLSIWDKKDGFYSGIVY